MVIGCYWLAMILQIILIMLKNGLLMRQKFFLLFIKKKLTIHTPVLVRYSVSNFKVETEKERMDFTDEVTQFSSNDYLEENF
jgi:hypothetical protein